MTAFTSLPFHPLAELFPLVEGQEFSALVEDVRKNGVRDPIVVHEGAVLDGRNRYRALMEIAATGELRGDGWGAYAGEPITQEDLLPGGGSGWFERYSPSLSGDPVAYVASKNLMRRHLTISQRAMLAADLGKLGWGGDRSKPSNDGLTVDRRAEIAQVGTASVERADVVKEHGIPELQDAVRKGDIAVAPAAEIARRPQEEQAEEVRRHLPNGARAIMGSRQEPDDSLDYFPTPPWATRALIERVLPQLGVKAIGRTWEPACGEGHISGVLEEYTDTLIASDVHDYSADGRSPPAWWRRQDFLGEGDHPVIDWIVTNPPFDDKALAFALKALDIAFGGVALFVRWQWIEGVGRYEKLFQPHPPALVCPFVERVPLCKGRWDPDGSTATAYCWVVWVNSGATTTSTRLFWIPPGCREALTRPDDRERFTATPVLKRRREPCSTSNPPATSPTSAAPSASPVPDTRCGTQRT